MPYAPIGPTTTRVPSAANRCRLHNQMAIPAMSQAGLLPPGVHDATIAEVEQTFGRRTPRRAELFVKFTAFLDVARGFGVFQAIIADGSFVTDKDAPGDIDAVLLLPRADLAKLVAHPDRQQILDQQAVKSKYEIHLFLDPLPTGRWTSFFQHLKPDDALARIVPPATRRGVLRIAL